MVLPLDMPDDYPWLPGSRRGLLSDLGELAARLGSPNVYDKRGETIFLYKPAYGKGGWSLLGGGVGFSHGLVSTPSLFDGISLKMVGGSSGAHLCRLEKYFDVIDTTTMGIECTFVAYDEVETLDILVDFADGVTTYVGSLRIDFTNRLVKYRNSAGGYTTLDSLYATFGGIDVFLYFKIVIDFATKTYVRALVGNHEYDMSDIPIFTSIPRTTEFYRFSIDLTSTNGNNGTGYLGHALLSSNDI